MSGPRNNTIYKIERDNIQNLKQSKENEIHIISVGPSVRNFNWSKLRGKDILTVNDALFHLPVKATYHIYNEPTNQEREIQNYNKASKYYHVHKFTTFPITGWHQLILYPGKNLAYIIAIYLAIDLKYSIANLYGYDFSCKDNYIHWWDDHQTINEIIKTKMELLNKQKDLFEKFVSEISDKIKLKHIYSLI